MTASIEDAMLENVQFAYDHSDGWDTWSLHDSDTGG